jgi:GNAT superfamily N-acetyltransferase
MGGGGGGMSRKLATDGALSAVIWDVAAAPAWQRGGLGRALVEPDRLAGSQRHHHHHAVCGWVRCGCAACAL